MPKSISRTLHICGFISLGDIGSPMSLSRHLVMPDESAMKPSREADSLENDIRTFYAKHDDDESLEQTKTGDGSALILLHGALKCENLAAVVLLNDDWYGFLHIFADSKRKSNILLTILPPGKHQTHFICQMYAFIIHFLALSSIGNENVPWLGDFRYFGTLDEALPTENPQFPIKPEKRSYSQNCVVWIKQAGLQSDVQKLLRHAKKLPEKTQQFYKVCLSITKLLRLYDRRWFFLSVCTGIESHKTSCIIFGIC